MKTIKTLSTAAQDYKKRLVKTFTGGNRTAKVYYDPDWQEHCVRFFEDGKEQKNATYHTEDKQDALDTAKNFAEKSGSFRAAATAADDDHVEAFLVGQADEACGIICMLLRSQVWGHKLGVGLYRGDTINVSAIDEGGNELNQTDEGYPGEVMSKVQDFLVRFGITADEDTDSGVLVVGVSTGNMYYEPKAAAPGGTSGGAEEGDRVKVLDQRWKDKEGTLVKYNGPNKPSVISLDDGSTIETTQWYNLEDDDR